MSFQPLIFSGFTLGGSSGGGGGGSVTSVALALPVSVFTVSGSPVTSSGTLTGSFSVQAANTVFAGPTSGGSSVPTFRSLVAADIPSLGYVSSVTASSPLFSSGGSTPNLTIQVANTSQNGYLSSTDWNTFNSKQASGSYLTALTGDVSASGPGSAAATVNSVGGSSAANIHSAELVANAATNLNTPSTIVKRDSSGNFLAGTITASLTGHASLDLALTGGTMSGSIAMGSNKITGLADGTNPGDAVAFDQLSNYVLTSEVGAANGVASLDSGGKVPVSQLPSSVMQYLGVWDASTNTPSLADGTGVNGDVYRVSVAGTVNFGHGNISFNIGDFVIYNGTLGLWQNSPAADGVTSVNGQMGAVTVNAINQLTGDVTAGPASGSQSKVATIASIQGTTVSGTTGTGNVVFSASPTFTGTITAAAANLSGAISASNFSGSSSGTNTGDQTITLTGAVTGSGTGSFATTLTNSSVTGQALTGFVSGPNSPVLATDSILQGLEKLQAQITASGGTVTSVGFADTSTTPIYTITNSPITTSGTIDQTLNTQNANTVFAGPSSGSAAQPTFRSLVSADIPNNAANTTGTASNITATSNSTLTTLSTLSLPTTQLTGPLQVAQFPALTGDITTLAGSFVTTLATVNSNVGTFGSSTSIPTFTVNAKGLITAASGNAVVAPAGTLTGTTLASNVVSSSLTSLGIQSQALNMGSNQINNVANPTSAQDAATKAYVDSSVAGLNPATSVYAATTGSNIPGTYFNGVAGIGATFTTTATGTFTVDGTTPPLGARILIKDQSAGFQNGIYNITTLGTIGISTVFTRALDYDTPTDINNAGLIPVINGTLNALTSWQEIATITTIGTDALIFQEFTANPSLYLLKANNLSDVSSKSTSFNNLSPMTTAGDIIYENSTPSGTRLPIGTSGQVLTVSGGLPAWISPATSGTVTSVALSDGSSTPIYSITGSPVTSSGTLTFTLNTQSANTFFAGPSTGSPAQPTFRAIVSSDIPTLNQNTTGTASNITTTSNSTLTTLSALSLPGSQVTGNISGNAANITATSNSTLTTLSSLSLPTSQLTGTLQAAQFPALTGDVTTTAGSLVTNLVATSNSTLTTLSALSLPTSQLTGTISLTSQVSGVLPIANGGTGDASFNANQVILGGTTSTGALQQVAGAILGYVLTANGTTSAPTFQSPVALSLQFFASSQVTTTSSAITSGSFTTFNNSPAFTFTPTISGTYKIYSSIPLYVDTVNCVATSRVINTSGGATLLNESQAALYGATSATLASVVIESVYILTSGVSYVFDIQAKVTSGSPSLYLRGDTASFYMFADQVG